MTETFPPIAQLLAGKRVLLAGSTGFLGKVFLARLLDACPEIAAVHCVVRGAEDEVAVRRFRSEVLRSPVFLALRERNPEVSTSWLESKLHPIAGDLALRHFGLSGDKLEELCGAIDVVVTCAGLVDFEARIDRAFEINVQGAFHAVEVARELEAQRLVYVSTCYVPGRCDGVHAEATPAIDWTPKGVDGFRLDREIEEIKSLIQHVYEEADWQDVDRVCRAEARRRLESDGGVASGDLFEECVAEQKERWLSDRLREEGLERAERLGWPNTYSYSKSLGEQLIAKYAGDLPYTIVRPAVIESADRFPFGGWNQGVNTSAPLMYLAKHGFRHWPATPDLTLDVVPVDWVADALLVVLATGLHEPEDFPSVVQVGTAARNPLPMTRLTELTALWLQKKDLGFEWLGGASGPVLVSDVVYRHATIPAWTRLAGALLPALNAVAEGDSKHRQLPAAGKLARSAGAVFEELESSGALVERLVNVFRPYVSELHYVFLCDELEALAARLTDSDRENYGFDPTSLDWRTYWLEKHLPGIERWSFPEMERRRRPKRRGHGLGELLRRACEQAPKRVLVVSEGVEIRRGEVLRRAMEFSSKLEAQGVEPGDPVEVSTEEGLEFPSHLLGILLRDAIPVLDCDSAPASRVEEDGIAFWIAGRLVSDTELGQWLDRARVIPVGGKDRVLTVLDSEDESARVMGFVHGWLVPWLNGASVLWDGRARGALRIATLRRQRPTLAVASSQAWVDLYREVSNATTAGEAGLAPSLRKLAVSELQSWLGVRPNAAIRKRLLPEGAERLGELERGVSVGGAVPKGLAKGWQKLGVALSEGLLSAQAGGLVGFDSRARGEYQACEGVQWSLEADPSVAGKLGFTLSDSTLVFETPWLAEVSQSPAEFPRTLARVRVFGPADDRFVLGDEVVIDPEFLERRLAFLPGRIVELGLRPVSKGASSKLGAVVVLDLESADDLERSRSEIESKFATAAEEGVLPEALGDLVFTPKRLPRHGDGRLDRVALLRFGEEASSRLVEHSVRRGTPKVESLPIPADLSRIGKRVFDKSVQLAFEHGFRVTVFGLPAVPIDRPLIVVSNHASHLDAGLVRSAMGSAGDRLSVLAARDYFFDSAITKTVMENFTQAEPFERKILSPSSVKQALALLENGRSILMFPEGTRGQKGGIRPFQSGVSLIALRSGVDVLPVYIAGTREALPKGARRIHQRDLVVHFGSLVTAEELRVLAEASGPADSPEAIAARLEQVVAELHAKEARRVGADPMRLRGAMESLERRFRAEEVRKPRCFYFSLGDTASGKWTVSVDSQWVEIRPGKPEGEADCVLKASPDVFVRMVEDGYIPPVSDFVAGMVKTNRPELLREFQRIFGL